MSRRYFELLGAIGLGVASGMYVFKEPLQVGALQSSPRGVFVWIMFHTDAWTGTVQSTQQSRLCMPWSHKVIPVMQYMLYHTIISHIPSPSCACFVPMQEATRKAQLRKAAAPDTPAEAPAATGSNSTSSGASPTPSPTHNQRGALQG